MITQPCHWSSHGQKSGWSSQLNRACHRNHHDRTAEFEQTRKPELCRPDRDVSSKDLDVDETLSQFAAVAEGVQQLKNLPIRTGKIIS